MKLSIYSYTNQGGREHNEDSLRWTSDGTEGVFVLADGLGGHDRGASAAGRTAPSPDGRSCWSASSRPTPAFWSSRSSPDRRR